MDWSNFNLHGDPPQRAFESLTGILFERWCHHEYSSQVSQVIFVNGAGGDGGVEAYAWLKNGDLIGLQAKWFRESLQSSQINQIRSSLNTAATQRSGLVRYVVAVPRDLSDGMRIRRQVSTERGRWNNFLSNAQTDHPGIAVDLWDETRIAGLLAELGSEGLRRYWFKGSVADLQYLCMRFNQAQSGWLSARYTPDLHQLGQIEQDLRIRLDGPSSYPAWLREVRKMRDLLEEAHVATQRLRRYPEFIERPDAEALIQAAEGWFTRAIKEEAEIENCLSAGNAFPIHAFESDSNISGTSDLQDLINVLLPNEGYSSQDNAVEPIGKQLGDLLEHWYKREATPENLRAFGYPAIYIGDPGIGKTHALANAVQQNLSLSKPAILIRARDVDLAQSWDSLLAGAIGEPGWNLRQVLDALESAAIQSEVRSIAEIANVSEHLPVRVLIAIDGLDETARAERWAEKLGELVAVARGYSRVLFAFSVRPSLIQRISLPINIARIPLRGSDAPLAEVFEAYCRINQIQCPPLLRWTLRTPLAIRLFAELYRGRRVDTISLQEVSLVELIKQKIDYAERSIRERDEEGWPESIKPVCTSLRAIAKACLTKGTALPQREAMQVVESAQSTSGILTRLQLLRILHQCRDQGLLLLRNVPSDDPLEEETYTWEPAYETLTDFLLAQEAYKDAQTSPNNPDLPSYLIARSESVTLTVYLLGKEGFNFFASKLWINDLTGQRREELQLIALSIMPSQQSEVYRDWVLTLFKRDMPSCRKVLDTLIVPGLRIPEYPYGARFVHDALLLMRVAERDLFWSGPYQIPYNHGAQWEGYSTGVLEALELVADDPWDSAPLLLAWATTTVNNSNRRRIRSALTIWGHDKPNELLALLQTAFQTNDPQMKEDLLTAAYGASCLTRPDETWLSLCEWVIDSFFTPNAAHCTHNLIIRHCARSLAERCLACTVLIADDLLIRLRKPFVDVEELLAIDEEAATHASEHDGIKPATSDLAWYVVPQAIKPFFERSHFANTIRSEHEESCEEINEDRDLLQGIKIQVSLWDGENESSERQEESQPSHYSQSAQALLEKHAKAYNLPNLTPKRLAFGFIRAYALNLGWSRNIFIGNPQGGKPGEILGADIAILRQHSPASHGEQSSISTFGEKYVWAATHELTGFLADRVTAHDWNNKRHEPPVNLGLLAEVNNPATDVGYGQLPSDKVLESSELIIDVDLTELLQIDRVNEWVRKAPLPSVEPLLLPESNQLPNWAQEHEWLVLSAYVKRRHVDSQAESIFWASSFALPTITTSLMEDCVRSGETRELHEFRASVDAMETYQDPCEVVWAPWIRESEGILYCARRDVIGKPKAIPLQAATCQFYWRSPEGEVKECVPAKWLRKLSGVVDFHAGQFLNAYGEVIGFTMRQAGEAWEKHQCHLLLARRDVVLSTLSSKNLTLAWGTRLYREPSYPLVMLSGEKRIFRDWCATVYFSNNKLTTVTFKDLKKTWS